MLKLRQPGFPGRPDEAPARGLAGDPAGRGMADPGSASRGDFLVARPRGPAALRLCAGALSPFLTKSMTDPRRFEQ